MKAKFERPLCILLITLLLWINVFPQLSLGPHRLVSQPAPTLRNPTRFRSAPRIRLSFLSRIGGVAFEGVAQPKSGLAVSKLNLTYAQSKKDGERLVVNVNGNVLSADIYDWQLIPIAKFANSDFYSCFTLFGNLTDQAAEKRILQEGGRILNYHPAFVDTLLGLRLFQLDNLIINRYAYDLPKQGKDYLLGADESEPNLQSNLKGASEFHAFRERNNSLFRKGRSYLISDFRREITFGMENQRLDISGEPSYYFWNYDPEGFTRLRSGTLPKQINEEIIQELEAASSQNPRAFDAKGWLVQQVLNEVQNYEKQIGFPDLLETLGQKEIADVLRTRTVAGRKALLNAASLESLLERLRILKILIKTFDSVEISDLSEKVSAQTRTLRAINPAVWDAGLNVMRYAAFFRYCRQKNPAQWRQFMLQINRAAKPRPFVKTPTVMEPDPGDPGKDANAGQL